MMVLPGERFTEEMDLELIPVFEEAKVESIRLDKTSLSMKEGESATLRATVLPTDAANKNVTWTTSNASVAKVSDGTVTAVAEGTATITVTTNDGGFQAKCTVTVEALKKYANILKQPDDMVGKAGASLKAMVTATGDGLTYQWYFKTTGTTAWKKSGLTGYNTATLTVVLTPTNVARTYKCIVTDRYGTSVETREVSARIAKLEIKKQPSSVSGTSGSQLSLHVQAVASEGEVSYQWQFKKKDADSWTNSGYDGNKTAILAVTANATNAGRVFRCVVKDNYGNVLYTNAVEVSTRTPLKITRQPIDQVGKPGSTLSASLTASGDGLSYQWYYKGISGTEWKKSGYTGYNTSTMQIQVNTVNLARLFKCVVSDRYGQSVESNAVTVKEAKITITRQPTNVGGLEGSMVKAEVGATGSGLSYQWQFRTKGTTAWKNSGLEGYNTKSLSIVVNTTNTNREFRCVIGDAYGNKETTNTISVFASSLKITKQPTDLYGASGDTVKAMIEATGNGLTFQWYFMNDGTDKWSKSGFAGNTTRTMSIPVNATTTKRSFKCIVTDANGVSVESNAIRVKVSSLKIVSQPSDIVSEIGALEEATVVAQGTGLTYQWYFKTIGTDSWKVSGYVGNKTATLEIPVISTALGRMFKCMVKDANGASVWTREVSVRLGNGTNRLSAGNVDRFK